MTESAAIATATNPELQLMRRAVRLRWPMTKEQRQKIFNIARKIADNVNCSTRDRLAAVKILIETDKINVAVTKLDDQKPSNQTNVQINVDPAEAGAVKIYLPHNFRD